MKRLLPRLPHLALVLPMIAAPAFVVLGSALALRDPGPVLGEAMTGAEATPAPLAAPIYLEILAPLTATMPAMDGILSVEIGLALDPATPAALIDRLHDTPEPYLAVLTGVMQDTGDGLGPGLDWAALRAPLAEALRERLNDQIEAEGLARPVREVLFLKSAWAPRGS